VNTRCAKCRRKFVNKKGSRRSTHHIYPQRWFKGQGPTIDLCQDCHQNLERIIPYPLKSKQFYERQLEIFLQDEQ